MRILLLAMHYPVASGRYVAEALRRLGHDVCTDGPPPVPGAWCDDLGEQYTWNRTPMPDGWIPELVLIMDSGIALEGKVADCPHAVYGVDNHVRDYRQFDGIADHFFLAHGRGYKMGDTNVTWLPCGYDPVTFTPGPALDKRPNDAALIGVVYGPRAELLYLLNGYKVLYGTGLVYEQYAAAYQSAKVSLVRSVMDDVAQRVWETAAMGCVVVKDANSDDEALGLVHHENCLIYNTPVEARAWVQYVLENPKAAQKIAKAGQGWAQAGSWDARAQEIVEWAQAAGKPQKGKKASETGH